MRQHANEAGNVVPFRRSRAAPVPAPAAFDLDLGPGPAVAAARRDQRRLMDTVYEVGTLPVAAADRATKLIASRLQVYGFLTIEEVAEDGVTRRLRPSEAVRATLERPWLLSRSSCGASVSVPIPARDGFLFEPAAHPA
ncbi:MAG: hypothetical protein PGN34_06080 [Methylobacterium frigidaeris]